MWESDLDELDNDVKELRNQGKKKRHGTEKQNNPGENKRAEELELEASPSNTVQLLQRESISPEMADMIEHTGDDSRSTFEQRLKHNQTIIAR